MLLLVESSYGKTIRMINDLWYKNAVIYSLSVATYMDANGDGVLDTPIVISLAEQPATLNGPFPRTVMFDSTGKPVESHAQVIQVSPITFANSSGTSTIKVSDNGQAVLEKP